MAREQEIAADFPTRRFGSRTTFAVGRVFIPVHGRQLAGTGRKTRPTSAVATWRECYRIPNLSRHDSSRNFASVSRIGFGSTGNFGTLASRRLALLLVVVFATVVTRDRVKPVELPSRMLSRMLSRIDATNRISRSILILARTNLIRVLNATSQVAGRWQKSR